MHCSDTEKNKASQFWASRFLSSFLPSPSQKFIFFSNLLNFQYNRKVLRLSYIFYRKNDIAFLLFSLEFLCFLCSPYTCSHTFTHIYIECSCIWYFHLEYWLNSIRIIWLLLFPIAFDSCLGFLPWSRLLSLHDHKSDYHFQSYFKCVCHFMLFILTYNTKLNYYCNHLRRQKGGIKIVCNFANVIQTRTNESMKRRQLELDAIKQESQ